MRLSDQNLEEYMEKLFLEKSLEEKTALKVAYREKFEKLNESHITFFSTLKEKVERVSFVRQFPGHYSMHPVAGINQECLQTLFSEAVEYLKSLESDFKIEFRMTDQESVKTFLEKNNFKYLHTRKEFTKDLNIVQKPETEQLQFKSWDQADMNLEEVAELMTLSAKGDPDFSEDEDALQCLNSYLSDAELYSKPDCIQIGFVDEFPAAIVVPQSVEEWGTLTYMGIIPKFRGKGFGSILQRHGQFCLKCQGATEYHGGTLSNNKAMLRVFEKNECKLMRDLHAYLFSGF